MQTVKFNLSLKFNGDVKPEHLNEIMSNITDAIIHEANHGQGISPDSSEIISEEVEINHILAPNPIIKRVY